MFSPTSVVRLEHHGRGMRISQIPSHFTAVRYVREPASYYEVGHIYHSETRHANFTPAVCFTDATIHQNKIFIQQYPIIGSLLNNLARNSDLSQHTAAPGHNYRLGNLLDCPASVPRPVSLDSQALRLSWPVYIIDEDSEGEAEAQVELDQEQLLSFEAGLELADGHEYCGPDTESNEDVFLEHQDDDSLHSEHVMGLEHSALSNLAEPHMEQDDEPDKFVAHYNHSAAIMAPDTDEPLQADDDTVFDLLGLQLEDLDVSDDHCDEVASVGAPPAADHPAAEASDEAAAARGQSGPPTRTVGGAQRGPGEPSPALPSAGGARPAEPAARLCTRPSRAP